MNPTIDLTIDRIKAEGPSLVARMFALGLAGFRPAEPAPPRVRKTNHTYRLSARGRRRIAAAQKKRRHKQYRTEGYRNTDQVGRATPCAPSPQ